MTVSTPKFQREASNEVYLGDVVPYSGHVSPSVVKTVDGAYCATWKIEGIPFQTSDAEDLLIRHDALNQMVRGLAGLGDVSIWIHRIRREFADQLSDDYDNDFASTMARRYYASFSGYRMMINETYFTVVYRPALAKLASNPLMRFVSGNASRTLAQVKADERAALKVMTDLSHQLDAGLKKYNATVLGMRDEVTAAGQVTISDSLTFYGYLLNGVWRQVAVQTTAVRNYLPHVRLFFGGEKLEIRTPDRQIFGALLDLKDYSDVSRPGILNGLFDVPFGFIETQSFSMMSKADAKSALEIQRNQLMATEDAASSQISQMDDAMDQLISGRFVMGEYHYSLAVFANTPEEAGTYLSQASTALNDAGFQAAMIDLVADAAWFAQLPANWKYRPRSAKITSRNFCGLAPLHGFSSGKRDNNPWGEAVTILKTPNGTPYYFNWHSTPIEEDSTDKKAPGNTTIIGMTGSGKTVLELFLLAMTLKYAPTVVVFDKDRGAEIAIRALGGNYRVLKRGVATGFNPFWLPATDQNQRFLETLVKTLIPRTLHPSEDTHLSNAIRQTQRFEPALRNLSQMCQMLPADNPGGGSMRDHLAKWCRGGTLGWVLDNPTDKIDLSTNTLYGFDDTDFLEDPEIRNPVTMYLLHCTQSLIDGRRFTYVMAEFWKRLESPSFTDFAVNQQFTIRKQNGFGIFDTQSPAQILKSPHVAAMVEQSATQIFLPNPKADRRDYVDGFKVTDAEYQVIRNLGESSRCFLVKQNGKSTVVKLDLSGMGDILDVLSTTADNVDLLDEIRLEVGDDPKRWMPILKARLAERRAFIDKRKHSGGGNG